MLNQMDITRILAQKITHQASHVIADLVNHRKISNTPVMIIDTLSVDNLCMTITGSLRYM